jgi:hypothetical protein
LRGCRECSHRHNLRALPGQASDAVAGRQLLAGSWGRGAAKPANEVVTDVGGAKPAIAVIPDACNPNPNSNPENLSNKGKAKATSKPANQVITDSEVITDLNPSPRDEVGTLAPRSAPFLLHSAY